MAKDTFNFSDAAEKLPIEDVASEYYVVTNPKTGERSVKLPQELTPGQIKAYSKQKEGGYPTVSVYDGKVSIVGAPKYLDSDIVNSTVKTLQDYYGSTNLENAQVAENFQKTLDEVNKQMQSQLEYQDYKDFLDKSGFSDEAYRNYALAKQEADPETSTNLLKSKKKFIGFKKDGTLTSKDEAMTPEEWFDYWKKNYTPEERIQLWMDSMNALSRAESDNDLYMGLPYLLMGAHEAENGPATFLNTVNPFNDNSQDSVVINRPIYGFEDVSDWNNFWDAFASTNKEAFYRLIGNLGEMSSPLTRFVGQKYIGKDISDPEKWGQASGLQGVTKEMINNITEKQWNEAADLVNKYFYSKNSPGNTADILEKELGKELAARVLFVRDFSTLPSTMGREKGWELYQKYKNYTELMESEGYKSPYAKWGKEREREMSEHIARIGNISPESTTFGVVAGTIGRLVGEQAALSIATSGALSASNIAAQLSKGGAKLTGAVLDTIGVGQGVLSKSPRLAAAVRAMAESTSTLAAGSRAAAAAGKAATGFKAGWATLDGAGAAAKTIYVLGSIGNWAARELGEDALRGLVDDTVTANSLDSQGNLDPSKLVENVYMNVIAQVALKGGKQALKGLGGIINMAAKNIDGVTINTSQRNQINLLVKALDDQYQKIQFRGYNSDGHPEIVISGKTKVLDQITPYGETAKAIEDITDVAAPTVSRTIEDVIEDSDVPEPIRQKIADVLEKKRIADEANGGAAENWEDDIKAKLQEALNDDEIREAFPDGTIKIGDDTIRIDTKELIAGDVGRLNGKEFATIDDAIDSLRNARTTRDFVNSVNGIMRQADSFAKSWDNAVREFADANDMTVRDVEMAIRDSRMAGEETVPGLRELWETGWKPTAEKLLDLEEAITGRRPASHDFYFRDMVEGTFNPGASGAWDINNEGIVGVLGGDADFDLSASSTARNTGKLGEIAADKLEYDPRVLAREFVASRLQSIWGSNDMGKIFATLQEAHDAGEFGLTEAEAAKSVGATETVARDVEASDGVQEIQKMANVEELPESFGASKLEAGEAASEAAAKAELDSAVKEDTKAILNTQKKFNESAKRSNAAELVSRNSGYKNRGVRVNPGKKLVGVNYMPGNPFGKFAKWINDHFMKANSIKMQFSGYKADGTPVAMSITAYNGGYKMYAEAGSFARNVVVDVRNGMSLWDAINKQVYDNGFFIEPSKSQRTKYGALTVSQQAAKVTDKIMDRIVADKRFAHVFSDDGTVKSTDGLVAILTSRFRGQGINDFTKFLHKANWDTFTKAEQQWLNARYYEMTASVNKSTAKKVADFLIKGSMALRYRSNMGWNLKNGQLQLTECQRVYTANKIGDFGSMLKRLATDKEFRAQVSDRTYILAADSVGAGFSKSDLDRGVDAFVQLGSESVINKNGIITDIDQLKAKFKDFDDSMLASVQGGEYAKNFIMVAGFTAAGERAGLSGAELDTYVRNRFNVEALAGTNVGRIGLTDSRIGQFTFMYLGFPIRELTLQAHLLKGGGTVGGEGFKKAIGSIDYLAKMIGAKGVVWAMEAPWGYSMLDQVGIDPFGVIGQYDPIQTDWEDREPGWRVADLAIQYNPFLQGAMTSAIADIYMSYRAAEEEARADYMKEHNGSTEGFEWSMFEDGGDEFQSIMKGLSPVWEQGLGFIPGRTAYQRIEGELQDLERGYRISRTGNRMYEANTDPANILWGMVAGRRNTANAQEYYQTANPIRGAIEGGWAGLGQQMSRGFGSFNPFRSFREFDPADKETFEDWFNGSYQDQQNWNTGVYAFREEAQQIKDKYDRYAQTETAIMGENDRENELADLRDRVEAFVQSYTDNHPEGISYDKQNQLINIFNLSEYQPTLEEAAQESEEGVDYSDWNAAQSRYAQGEFPTPYGLRQTNDGSNIYGQSPQLQQVLSQQRYGIDSDVAPIIKRMYENQQFDTPLGRMTMKEYRNKVYNSFSSEYDKSKPDYKKISKIQGDYLEVLSKNIIQPILNTYGSGVLSASRSSDIMQEFGRMLNGMVPSEEYRMDKKGKKIYQSTPYMTVDIRAWLNKNFKAYSNNVNVTNRATQDRLDSIRNSLDLGHTSTAMSKVRALIRDIGAGRASVSRDELEWLQGILND